MATATEYLGLTKPAEEEYVSVDVINENMEKIDLEARSARPVKKGGTGKTSWAVNRLIYASAAEVLAQMAFPTTAGSFLRQDKSGAPYWSTPAQVLAAIGALPDETVPITKGGTGATDAATACNNLGAVKKTGDAMTGALIVQNTARVLGWASGNMKAAQFVADDWDTGSYTTVQITHGVDIADSLTYARAENNATTFFGNLFGDHNKPTGSYTGNGSATTRYIDIGANSDAVLIRRSSSNEFTEVFVFAVKSNGGFGKSGTTVKSLTNQQIGIGEKQLVITSNDDMLNANGIVYKYYVL